MRGMLISFKMKIFPLKPAVTRQTERPSINLEEAVGLGLLEKDAWCTEKGKRNLDIKWVAYFHIWVIRKCESCIVRKKKRKKGKRDNISIFHRHKERFLKMKRIEAREKLNESREKEMFFFFFLMWEIDKK